MKTIILSLAAPALLAATASASIVVNGDFESGSLLAPASSAYALDSSMYPESTYNVVSYDTIHPAWVDFFDHTRGDASGHFMVVNGSSSSMGPAWTETVGVTPGVDYNLSAWYASLYPEAIANVSMRVFGVDAARGVPNLLASGDYLAPSDLATWGQRSLAFNSGGYSAVTIELWDTNLAWSGNDYAIDDIAVNAVPSPASAALAGVSALVVFRRRR